MAISSNYITMQRQVADELGDRQDLLVPLGDSALTLSPIQNAIQSAIAKWERFPFYFNEVIVKTPLSGPYDFSTVLGQEYYSASDYAALNTLPGFISLWVLVASNRYPCTPRTPAYLDEISINPATQGMPTDYAYAAGQLRFYPIPDAIYPVGYEGTQRLTATSAPTDANAWFTDGFDLIRSEAKLILAAEVLHDEDIKALAVRAIHGDPEVPTSIGYLTALRAETTRRRGRSRVRPSNF